MSGVLGESLIEDCGIAILGVEVSPRAELRHRQSLPTTQVSQFVPPPLGAGDASCCPGLL